MSDIEQWDTCTECNGEGHMEVPKPQHDDPYFCIVLQCPLCGGSGWVLTGWGERRALEGK